VVSFFHCQEVVIEWIRNDLKHFFPGLATPHKLHEVTIWDKISVHDLKFALVKFKVSNGIAGSEF